MHFTTLLLPDSMNRHGIGFSTNRVQFSLNFTCVSSNCDQVRPKRQVGKPRASCIEYNWPGHQSCSTTNHASNSSLTSFFIRSLAVNSPTQFSKRQHEKVKTTKEDQSSGHSQLAQKVLWKKPSNHQRLQAFPDLQAKQINLVPWVELTRRQLIPFQLQVASVTPQSSYLRWFQ